MREQRAVKLIRKSPAIIVKSFLALQLAGVALFFLASVLFHFAKIYRALPLATNILPFQAAQVIFVFAVETLLIFYIFFAWYKEYLEIRKDRLVHHHGIIFRKKTAVSLANICNLAYRQGPLGRLVKYGTLEWQEGSFATPRKFAYLPKPQNIINLILRLKNSQSTATANQLADFLTVPAKIEDLLVLPENEQLEFKASLRWDTRRQQVNKELEKTALKTVAAFLNSRGGCLVIGVDDRRQVVGLEDDYRSLPHKPDPDGFANHFSNLFRQHIGAEFWPHLKLSQSLVNNRSCCLISIAPSSRPVFLNWDRGEEFFIRTGNNSTALPLSHAQNYINQRFRAS